MAHDMSLGICLSKLFQEGTHGGFLSLGAGVIRAALGSQASFINNAQRAVVVVTGVNALDILRKEGIDSTVSLDVPMIGYLSETGKARIDQRFGAERTVTAVADTMNDQEGDRLERFQFFLHNGQELENLEPMRSAALNSKSTGNGSKNGSKDLENLFNGRPLKFHFTQN